MKDNAVNVHQSVDDPLVILGIPGSATADEIRAAYLAKIKEFPPDKDPAKFEAIRDAYEILKNPYRKAEFFLTTSDAPKLLMELLATVAATRNRVAESLWFDAIKSAYDLKKRTVTDE